MMPLNLLQRVYSDIRNLVHRDRNHACVWLWEPILNETWYPDDFAKKTRELVDQEYPYPYCYSGCDSGARGKEYFRYFSPIRLLMGRPGVIRMLILKLPILPVSGATMWMIGFA